MKNKKKVQASSCDTCANYVYDDEYGYYECLVNLDEDEMYNFVTGNVRACPYFQHADEYRIVRKQI